MLKFSCISLASHVALGSKLCLAIDMFHAIPRFYGRCLGLAMEI